MGQYRQPFAWAANPIDLQFKSNRNDDSVNERSRMYLRPYDKHRFADEDIVAMLTALKRFSGLENKILVSFDKSSLLRDDKTVPKPIPMVLKVAVNMGIEASKFNSKKISSCHLF